MNFKIKIMKKLCFILTGIFSTLHSQEWKTEEQYIQNFAKYAVEEMVLYKIPASIKLAQGILETGGGQSRLAKQGKNHFGIKCKEDWFGKTMKHTDDAPNECFRVYDDARESYRDHSIFLSTRKYYTELFKLDIKDYKRWAHGLKQAGYATNPRYAYILIDKIEKHRLYEFDNLKPHEVENKLAKLYPGYKSSKINNQSIAKVEKLQKVHVVSQDKNIYSLKDLIKKEIINRIVSKFHPNGLQYVILEGNMDLYHISKKYGIRERRLISYNDLKGRNLQKGQIIFLEAKKSSGSQEFYITERGDTMYNISQRFGIKLKKLYAKNRMKKGLEPGIGQIIYLQYKKPKTAF